MDLAQKLSYTVSHNYKPYHPSQNPPQLVAKCHNFTTLEDCSVSQNCARFFVGLFGQFSFALVPAGKSRHDGAVKHILQVLLSQRAALHIQLTTCTAVKSFILFTYFPVFRIRIWFQCGSGCGSGLSNLGQYGSGSRSRSRVLTTKNWKNNSWKKLYFLMKNCNLVISRPP